MRAAYIFLTYFSNDISRPISEYYNIEYIPTQIVTEYLRHVYKTDKGVKIDGILYKSSKNKGGVNIVIFTDASECSENVMRYNPFIKRML